MPEAGEARAVPDSAELVARAAAMRETLRSRAEACDKARTTPDETMWELRDAGLFRILQPRRFGGYELDFATLINAVTEVARGCGSTGWVYMIGGIHQWLAAQIPVEVQDEIWGRETDTTVSGSYAPSATAKPVPGGYRVSGVWGFASGCDHAGWHVAGIIFPPAEPARKPGAGFVLRPRAHYTIEDNWYTVGLAGTGSKNIRIDDAFVPHHRTITFQQLSTGQAPGAAAHKSPLYYIPFLAAFPACLASTGIGIAEDAIDAFIDMAATIC
jgi:alkylation response protein AidB-like acyl-CoA dehydrogenase